MICESDEHPTMPLLDEEHDLTTGNSGDHSGFRFRPQAHYRATVANETQVRFIGKAGSTCPALKPTR